VQKLWKANVFFPDAPTATYANNRAMFIGGKVVVNWAGYVAWPVYVQEALADNPKFEIQGIVLPKWSGGGQATYLQTSGAGPRFTALKQASDAQTDKLLRILDWIATPFGSEEYLFTTYGLADRDYTLNGADPIATSTGTAEVQAMSVTNFSRPYIPIYVAGQSEMAKAEHEIMSKLLEVSEPLPTVGLSSETDLTKGTALAKPLSQLQMDIILGRKKISEWDSAVKTWLSKGGSKIAQEYEASCAASPLH
jgi:putative aldouronate transport system substrate-binding protein